MARIAFIGLGVMGAPMARHLTEAGHNVVVYNRTIDRARANKAYAPAPWHGSRLSGSV